MGSDAEKDLAQKLRSTNTSDVYDALVKIRKNYVRNQQKMKKLQKYSVIELIITFLEHPKFCNISLSIIADGCLELSFANEVIKCNGINSLMRIMKSFVNDDIKNRACRALGNVAKFEVGFKAIHLMKPVSIIINFLSETSDVNCQQTAVRTLMILGKNSKTRELITRENGIVCIAKLLHSSDVQVLICSTKALANLTQNCRIPCARQLLELQFLKVLVELYSHSEKSVQNHALMSLKNLSSQEEIRSDLVKVGAVKLFTEILTSFESCEMGRLAALALCNCLDHIHMWSHNGIDRSVGLKALLIVLKSKHFQDIHIHVIASLIPLSYESKVSDILLNLDIIQILIEILGIFIVKHKCKSIIKTFNMSYLCEKKMFADSKKDKECEVETFSSTFQLNLTNNKHVKYSEDSEIEVSKEVRDNDSYESKLKALVFLDKSKDTCLPKPASKWDRSLYSGSITSDYSGSCSPYRMCSPVRKLSVSPEVNSEVDVGSPSTGHISSGVWSPASLDENMDNVNCWSPVVSTDSDSFTLQNDFNDNEEVKEAIKLFPSTIKNTTDIETDTLDVNIETSINCNFSSSHKSYPFNTEKLSELKNKSSSDKHLISPENEAKRKKLKIEDLNIGSHSQPLNINDLKNADSDAKYTSEDNKNLYNFKQLNENDAQTIDHFIILLIFQLSFHIEKRINSQIADKICFSVLIDYLCFIHNPSPKAETVLLNLIKNRYCFEKLILNGFVSELAEKMASPYYSCTHRASVKVIYSKLIRVGREEVESDYGIGTLSHILVTSEKIGQFHAICAMSKLVTEKAALFRLLFQANGLSLLLNFLSDNIILTQIKAVISLCELYQSLTKEQKTEKCCFQGTCSMKTSTKCSYKNYFLNVTFSVLGGIKILANREKICENSEYFSALLEGNFQESNSKMVYLPSISAENLSTIFHFLHGCGSGNCCPYIARIPFSVLLELLSDCDKLLLMNIKVFVEDRLCHHLLPSTVPKIYRQSKIHNSPGLTKRALDFVLNMDTSQNDLLWSCFEELINLDSNLDFLDDIKNLLKSLF